MKFTSTGPASVTSPAPSGTSDWGNNGLHEGNWSVPGGVANDVDTVENVFVQNPEAGLWTVEVLASEINEDAHLETPQIDADFAPEQVSHQRLHADACTGTAEHFRRPLEHANPEACFLQRHRCEETGV